MVSASHATEEAVRLTRITAFQVARTRGADYLSAQTKYSAFTAMADSAAPVLRSRRCAVCVDTPVAVRANVRLLDHLGLCLIVSLRSVT
jgi:hypothetical protein